MRNARLVTSLYYERRLYQSLLSLQYPSPYYSTYILVAVFPTIFPEVFRFESLHIQAMFFSTSVFLDSLRKKFAAAIVNIISPSIFYFLFYFIFLLFILFFTHFIFDSLFFKLLFCQHYFLSHFFLIN